MKTLWDIATKNTIMKCETTRGTVGIYVLPRQYCNELYDYESWTDKTIILYELNTFAKMLYEQDPVAIELLWCDPENIIMKTPVYNILRKNRHWWLTTKIKDTFAGSINHNKFGYDEHYTSEVLHQREQAGIILSQGHAEGVFTRWNYKYLDRTPAYKRATHLQNESNRLYNRATLPSIVDRWSLSKTIIKVQDICWNELNFWEEDT